MGVETKADRCISEAKEKINEAYKLLLYFLEEEKDEYNFTYINSVHEVAVELLQIKHKLQ